MFGVTSTSSVCEQAEGLGVSYDFAAEEVERIELIVFKLSSSGIHSMW